MYVRRVSIFVLKDKKGRLLLQHRAEDARRLPGYWGFFGGGIEENEEPEDAVRREAKEELGIDLENLEFFKRYELQQNDGVHEKFVYVAPLNLPLEVLKKQQKEGQDLGLFSFDELADLKIIEYDKVVLKDLFK